MINWKRSWLYSATLLLTALLLVGPVGGWSGSQGAVDGVAGAAMTIGYEHTSKN